MLRGDFFPHGSITDLSPRRESIGERCLRSAARGHSIACITHADSLPTPEINACSPRPCARLTLPRRLAAADNGTLSAAAPFAAKNGPPAASVYLLFRVCMSRNWMHRAAA